MTKKKNSFQKKEIEFCLDRKQSVTIENDSDEQKIEEKFICIGKSSVDLSNFLPSNQNDILEETVNVRFDDTFGGRIGNLGIRFRSNISTMSPLMINKHEFEHNEDFEGDSEVSSSRSEDDTIVSQSPQLENEEEILAHLDFSNIDGEISQPTKTNQTGSSDPREKEPKEDSDFDSEIDFSEDSDHKSEENRTKEVQRRLKKPTSIPTNSSKIRKNKDEDSLNKNIVSPPSTSERMKKPTNIPSSKKKKRPKSTSSPPVAKKNKKKRVTQPSAPPSTMERIGELFQRIGSTVAMNVEKEPPNASSYEYPKSEKHFRKLMRKVAVEHQRERKRLIDTHKQHLTSTVAKFEKLKKHYVSQIGILEQEMKRTKKKLDRELKTHEDLISKEKQYQNEVEELQTIISHRSRVSETKNMRTCQLMEKLETDLQEARQDRDQFEREALRSEAETEHLRTELEDNKILFEDRLDNMMDQHQKQLEKQEMEMKSSFQKVRMAYEKMMDNLVSKQTWKTDTIFEHRDSFLRSKKKFQESIIISEEEEDDEEDEESEGIKYLKKVMDSRINEYEIIKNEISHLHFYPIQQQFQQQQEQNLMIQKHYLEWIGTRENRPVYIPRLSKIVNGNLLDGTYLKLPDLFFDALEERFERILQGFLSCYGSISTPEIHLGWYLFQSLFYLYQVMWELPNYNNSSHHEKEVFFRKKMKKKEGMSEFSFMFPVSPQERSECLSLLAIPRISNIDSSNMMTPKHDDDDDDLQEEEEEEEEGENSNSKKKKKKNNMLMKVKRMSLIEFVERLRCWLARGYYILFQSTFTILIPDMTLFLNHHGSKDALRKFLLTIDNVVIKMLKECHHIFPSIAIHFLKNLTHSIDVYVANYYFFNIIGFRSLLTGSSSIHPLNTLQIKMGVSKIEDYINKQLGSLHECFTSNDFYNNTSKKKKEKSRMNHKRKKKKKSSNKKLFRYTRQCCDICAMPNKEVFLKDESMRNFVCPDLSMNQIENILDRIDESGKKGDISASIFRSVEKTMSKEKRLVLFRTRITFNGGFGGPDETTSTAGSVINDDDEHGDRFGVKVWRKRFSLFEIGLEERKAFVRAMNFVMMK